MDNIQIIETENINGEKIQHVVIWHNENEFTSMLKSTWDEQQKAAELGETL